MNKNPAFNAEDEKTAAEICAQLSGSIQNCYSHTRVAEQAQSAAATLHALEDELSQTRNEVKMKMKRQLKLESMLKITRKLRAENEIGALFDHTMQSVKDFAHAESARVFLSTRRR